ncbi:F5/8 type C domain-containing protein [Maribacter vaceletii]|uniref:F5/8 type C domain-containing protein n=1 Tax=Maribacter vaceletii TaxID=1206816 RepID=A0A495EBV4_9FLAO|nr:discoidin domain-containing protein [Maribacter vaceletii]RKR14340.1 F5/8 type C domain-containing protein [Maribacter vaceletii]
MFAKSRKKTATNFLNIVLGIFSLGCISTAYAQNNLSTTGTATSNNTIDKTNEKFVNDGNLETAWVSDSQNIEKWVSVELPGNTEVTKIDIQLDYSPNTPPTSYALQTYMNGRWREFVKKDFKSNESISIILKKPMLTDHIRFSVNSSDKIVVKEFEIYGIAYKADLTKLKEILINQSGYNLGQPKRFTAPNVKDNTSFVIKNTTTQKDAYKGKIKNHVGDFTSFNPNSKDEYIIIVNKFESYPFRIGPYWLERVSYQNAVDFMAGARHYVGTTKKISKLSWAYRDGDFFNWALQGLIAQYLSNPEAYKRLEKKINYVDNSSFSKEYNGLWGALEKYKDSAPDIVKIIHWDVDVKISQKLEHEHQKAELAHFLYAYPYLKEWLPQQNYDVVYEYLTNVWDKEDVRETSTTKYDKSEGHNLFALKTKMGTNKGELPPGHSVIPNLMMYEVVKRKSPKDAQKYFDAAFTQMQWMIENLDWKDPITTKGQRMSEHITMRAFAYFYNQYPNKAPKGLQKKVTQWIKVMVARSNNMWDFRKYTDNKEWAPIGWNETGNVLGFPAAALAAKSVMKDTLLKKELNRIAWSHLDNSFGRNPTGRHFSFDGPREIEGVDLGWYNDIEGGIGLLAPVPFVFDGSPKAEHYPNHPELGNIGWTEGWVQFNTAFNASLAYLANDNTNIKFIKTALNKVKLQLQAPINFSEEEQDSVRIKLQTSKGQTFYIKCTEQGPFSKYLVADIVLKRNKMIFQNQTIKLKKGETITASYGLGYFKKEAKFKIE